MLTPDLSHWQSAAADRALLTAAAAAEPGDVNTVARLRKTHTAQAVAAALALARARAKARTKFPARAEGLLADPAGIEQATSARVAAHKAQRFVAHGRPAVVDLGCGIGGDTAGFKDAGLAVTAVDLDPVRAWMAGHNAGVPAVVADASGWHSPRAALHLDPARRTAAGRVYRLADTLPPPDVVSDLVARHPRGVAVKLSPAVHHPDLAELLPPGEVEFISEGGRLVQAVLWTGGLAPESPPPRRATLLAADGTAHTHAGAPGEPRWSEPRRLLFTADPSLERAGLLHAPGLPAIHPKLGLLTADADPGSPWLTGFELIEQLPYREKKVRAALHRRSAGVVEVKTRGGAVDPDQAQRRLRGPGKTPFTVFVLRWDRRVVALITRRLAPPATR